MFALTPLIAILYYDYTLTISNEIDFFWRSANVSLVSALYVIIRYYGLLGAVPLIVEYFADLSEQVMLITLSQNSILTVSSFTGVRFPSWNNSNSRAT